MILHMICQALLNVKWGVYEGKSAVMITADNYAYVPVRISFTENNSGKVTFTVTDKDVSKEEVPVVNKYGDNDVNMTEWDFSVRSIAEVLRNLKQRYRLQRTDCLY